MSEQNHKHDNQDHEHNDEHNNEHNGEHNHGFGNEKTELYFAIGSGVFWLTGLILSFMATIPAWLPLSLFIIAFLLGGFFTLIEAYEAVKSGKFEIDFLMLVAAAGAAALGKWEEGALLLFLFSLGHSLEKYAMNKAPHCGHTLNIKMRHINQCTNLLTAL